MALSTVLDELPPKAPLPRSPRAKALSLMHVIPARADEPADRPPVAPLRPLRARPRPQSLAPGARALCLSGALSIHAALLAGGLFFDWFGMRTAAESFITAEVTLLPASKAVPVQARPSQAVTLSPPLLVPLRPSFDVEASEAVRAITVLPSASESTVRSRYVSKLAAHLERYKRYPPEARRRREEGEALLRFLIDRAGRVLSFEIVQSSGSALLDQEVAALIARASPLPPIPNSIAQERLTVIVPIEFALH